MGKTIFGFILVVSGDIFALYLSLYVMLYGGIMAIVDNWDVNNSAVVWGILQAWFCAVGAIPGIVMAYVGLLIMRIGLRRVR